MYHNQKYELLNFLSLCKPWQMYRSILLSACTCLLMWLCTGSILNSRAPSLLVSSSLLVCFITETQEDKHFRLHVSVSPRLVSNLYSFQMTSFAKVQLLRFLNVLSVNLWSLPWPIPKSLSDPSKTPVGDRLASIWHLHILQVTYATKQRSGFPRLSTSVEVCRFPVFPQVSIFSASMN